MIAVTGVNGQLGYDVVRELKKRNIPCIGTGRTELDITDKGAVLRYFDSIKPSAVIHCAAYNSVDKAENDIDSCNAVNISGTENIALACKMTNAKMMFFSSDYVFDGEKNGEYEIDDKKKPLSVYGISKASAEDIVVQNIDKHFILRISWAFGINGSNFVKNMLKLSESKASIYVVNDQIGSPTYTRDLAQLICDMIVTEKYGIYHATNEGFCSRAELAQKIYLLKGKNTAVNPVFSDEYPTAAKRPLNSRLSKKSLDKAGFSRLPGWEDALERYIKEMEQSNEK